MTEENKTCIIPPHLHACKISEKIKNNNMFKELMKLCIQTLENSDALPIYLPIWYSDVRGRFSIKEKYPNCVIKMVITELNKAGYHIIEESISDGTDMTPYIVINTDLSLNTQLTQISSIVQPISPQPLLTKVPSTLVLGTLQTLGARSISQPNICQPMSPMANITNL